VAAGAFFVLRTPLLPFETIARLGEGLTAPAAIDDPERLAQALDRDRSCLRAALRDLAAVPAIRDAIFVASPDLDAAVDVWLADPGAPRARSVERSLVRYLTRMSARPTPFGLFASTAVGAIGEGTGLEIASPGECRRHTRLDMEYLTALSEALSRDESTSARLQFRPNSTLYRAADRWRYVESRVEDKARTHHLVAVDDSPALQGAIARAATGATRAELAAALADDEVTRAEADAFVDDLIGSQILVSDFDLPVTGVEPHDSLRAILARHEPDSAAAGVLASAAAELQALDRAGVGVDPAPYRAVAQRLSALPASVDPARLFQVDLVRPPGRSTLGRNVVDEIERGADILCRLTPRPDRDELAVFREAFVERYEGRAVPLLEALDEESGVGSSLVGGGREASPLVRDLAIPRTAAESIRWGTREAALLRRAGEALAAGDLEIALTSADIDALAVPDPLPLPHAYAAMVTIAAADAAACARGDFHVLLHGVSGPSGAALLGRFCHADPDLAAHVRGHLRDEEARDPDAVFAEVTHLPQGRLGNILIRPVLRDYELPYLGASGAPPDRQLAASDLTLSVVAGRFELRSTRLGRRVIPRLTNAHNFSVGTLGVYRLLCLLQAEGCTPGASWDWGPLSTLPFLPRVTSGRLVLSRAMWTVPADEVRRITAVHGRERYARVQGWRSARRLPRWIVVNDGDHTLPVDLDNTLAVESFAQLIGGRTAVTLSELYPGPEDLCARGTDGRFVHEIIVPLLGARSAPAPERRPPMPAVSARPRTFPPGSEWVYAKLYTGVATADRVLHDVVGPVSQALVDAGDADGWFFIRYADPDQHLRWRVRASGPRRVRRVIGAVTRAGHDLIGDGRVRRLTFDTYERESERYGGDAGIEAAESLFHADSDATLEVLAALASCDDREDRRWRAAVAGVDRLLDDFGVSLDGRLDLMTSLRAQFGREFHVDAATRRQLAARYRAVRASLTRLIGERRADSSFEPVLAALDRRSARIRPVAGILRREEAARRLAQPTALLAESFVHMHVNRLLRAEHRLHELVIYDCLAKVYEHLLARREDPDPVRLVSGR
jgi:thiopeptide-type bacteriocin biosynthesis protein